MPAYGKPRSKAEQKRAEDALRRANRRGGGLGTGSSRRRAPGPSAEARERYRNTPQTGGLGTGSSRGRLTPQFESAADKWEWQQRHGKHATKTIDPAGGRPTENTRPYAEGYVGGPPPAPPDPLQALINQLLNGSAPTPSIDLATYLKPYDEAEAQLNAAALGAHQSIQQNADSLRMLLAARRQEDQANAGVLRTDLQQGLDTANRDIAAATQHLGPGSPEAAAVLAENAGDLASMGQMRSDIQARDAAGLRAEDVSRETSSNFLTADAKNLVEANKLRALLEIGRGRAEATNQYNANIAEAQTDAQAGRFDQLKFLMGLQNQREQNDYRRERDAVEDQQWEAEHGGGSDPKRVSQQVAAQVFTQNPDDYEAALNTLMGLDFGAGNGDLFEAIAALQKLYGL